MSTIAIGLGVATAAFLVSLTWELGCIRMLDDMRLIRTFICQGRAGLVAYRRSKGGVNAMGKAFYKGLVICRYIMSYRHRSLTSIQWFRAAHDSP